jgi:hypothetical protein
VRYIISFILLIAIPRLTDAQLVQSGDFIAHINTLISALPGASSNEYTDPTNTDTHTWELALQALDVGDFILANSHANAVEYDLVLYTDNGTQNEYLTLQKQANGTNFWGTYVFNANPCRSQLVIQSPHPKKDFNTGKEGAWVFHHIGARAFFLSGANRCNSTDASLCDGTTSVCLGTSSPFQISDQAHNDQGFFQVSTSWMNEGIDSLYFIQFHGFSKDTADPYVILSNGSYDSPTSHDYLFDVENELLLLDNTLSFKTAHLDIGWTRLVGRTNTQGRYLNSTNSPCDTYASTNTGRFLHIEQEKTKLRDDSVGWNKMRFALEQTFACDTAFSDTANSIQSRSQLELHIFPNPTRNQLYIQSKRQSLEDLSIRIFSIYGVAMPAPNVVRTTNQQMSIDVSRIPDGIYFLQCTAARMPWCKPLQFVKQSAR